MSLETPNQIHADATIVYTYRETGPAVDVALAHSHGINAVRRETLDGFPLTIVSLVDAVSPLEAFVIANVELESDADLVLVGPPLDPGVFPELDGLQGTDVAMALDVEFPTETEGEQVRASCQIFRLPLLGL